MKDVTPANQSVALTTRQVKTLLTAALEAPAACLASSRLDGRAGAAQRLLNQMGARVGEPCEGIVIRTASATTSLSVLRRTKELAKRLLMTAENPEQRDAATFLYHLAVAAALHGHGEHISKQPLQRQKDIYRRLSRLFHGDVAGCLFEEAAQ